MDENKSQKGNVLLVGFSGVGKTTLIRSVLNDDKAVYKTNELEVHENDELPFRLIDTIGFEPSAKKTRQAIHEVQKWSKDHAKEGNEDNQINLIWFCVDGTGGRLFDDIILFVKKATKMWEGVPIIVVITKSYAPDEREKNTQMVYSAFAKSKASYNLCDVIPVVAQTFKITDTAFAPPENIDKLIDKTNEMMPEGLRIGGERFSKLVLSQKRALAQAAIAASTAGAVAIAIVPIANIADSSMLVPLEGLMLGSLAKIYGQKKDDLLKEFIESIVKIGGVTLAAKTILSVIANIPGIGLPATVLNAVVAGSIVLTLGEVSALAFEQIYLGNKSLVDTKWVEEMLKEKFDTGFMENLKEALESLGDKTDKNTILQAILKSFSKK